MYLAAGIQKRDQKKKKKKNRERKEKSRDYCGQELRESRKECKRVDGVKEREEREGEGNQAAYVRGKRTHLWFWKRLAAQQSDWVTVKG